jgi:hypothetical protein
MVRRRRGREERRIIVYYWTLIVGLLTDKLELGGLHFDFDQGLELSLVCSGVGDWCLGSAAQGTRG